jgi:molybdopterin-guanine dinucleotide biosynthesis protein A
MGTDKATLVVHGRRLGDRALDALRGAGLVRLAVVGGTEGFGVELVPDEHPGAGPLGALVTAFTHLDAAELVVLPCDLPRVDADAVAALVAAATDHPGADVVVASVAGRPAYPVGVWRRPVAGRLAAAFGGGERRVAVALDGADVVHVAAGDRLRDADRPDELPSAGILPETP